MLAGGAASMTGHYSCVSIGLWNQWTSCIPTFWLGNSLDLIKLLFEQST